MNFDPARPSSATNRARPITAAAAFTQAEAKSRIMGSKNAIRVGLIMAMLGAFELLRYRLIGRVSDVAVTLPGGQIIGLTIQQLVGVLLIPIGLIVAAGAYVLHRRFLRAALADPVTAGIFDPSVEWPEEMNERESER
jgi:hypothetical protein